MNQKLFFIPLLLQLAIHTSTLPLAFAAKLKGTIKDAITGEALPSIKLEIRSNQGSFETLTTDAEGAFESNLDRNQTTSIEVKTKEGTGSAYIERTLTSADFIGSSLDIWLVPREVARNSLIAVLIWNKKLDLDWFGMDDLNLVVSTKDAPNFIPGISVIQDREGKNTTEVLKINSDLIIQRPISFVVHSNHGTKKSKSTSKSSNAINTRVEIYQNGSFKGMVKKTRDSEWKNPWLVLQVSGGKEAYPNRLIRSRSLDELAAARGTDHFVATALMSVAEISELIPDDSR